MTSPAPRPAFDRRTGAVLFLGGAVSGALVSTLVHLAIGGEPAIPATPTPAPMASASASATPIATSTPVAVVSTAQQPVTPGDEPAEPAGPFAPGPGEKAVGLLSVSSEPSGGQVLVNGVPIARSPALIPNLPVPRRYLVEVRLEGHSPWSREVDVFDDQAQQVVAHLRTIDVPGKLRVVIPRGGKAFVDGHLAGNGPTTVTLDVSAGKHQLRLKDAGGMVVREYEVLVAKGRVTEIELPPP